MNTENHSKVKLAITKSLAWLTPDLCVKCIAYGGVLNLYVQLIVDAEESFAAGSTPLDDMPATFLQSIDAIENIRGYRYCEQPSLKSNYSSPAFQGTHRFRIRQRLLGHMHKLKIHLKKIFKPQKEPIKLSIVNQSLIHCHAYFAGDKETTGNLSASILQKLIHDKRKRNLFLTALMNNGLSENLSCLIACTFPAAFLEGYKKVCSESRHYEFLVPSEIYSSIYGLADDPVLHLLSFANQSKLYYVQHGGCYGLGGGQHAKHEIEGCVKMIYWGLGETNIFPSSISKSSVGANRHLLGSMPVMIVLSFQRELSYIEHLIHIVTSAYGDEVIVCVHPRSSLPMRDIADRLGRFAKVSIVRGVSKEDIVYSRHVIYDSIHHTLMYWSLVNSALFSIVQNELYDVNILPRCLPTHERGVEFVSMLNEAGIACSIDSLGKKLARLQDDQKYKQCMMEGLEQVAHLISSNPSLYELIENGI